MNTVVIDGREYVLVPKDELEIIPPAPVAPVQESTSPLEDFLGYVDDGLATPEEKQSAIQVHTDPNLYSQEPQAYVTETLPVVPPAQPKRYEYREKYLNHEITASDVFALPSYKFGVIKNYVDVPMIEADKKRPKDKQLFYGEGQSVEGASDY